MSTRVRGIKRSSSNRHGNVMGSMIGPNLVVAKDVKSYAYCCYVRCVTLIVRVGGMPWPQTGATHYHAQLGLPDKGRAIKGLIICYVVWLVSMIYGMGLWTNARCVGLVPCCGQDGYQAQMPQQPIDTSRYSTIH